MEKYIYVEAMDFRHNPKTEVFCAVCQHDLKSRPTAYIFLSEKPAIIVDPAQLDGNELKVPVGPECLKKIPNAYIVKI